MVENGEIRYLSPSSITTGDPTQVGGCGRRWHFKYIAGRKEPTTAAMSAGTGLHSQIQHYLETGEKTLDSRALAGSRYIPPIYTSGDGALLVEHEITEGELTAAGIPVIGYIDLVKVGRAYADEDGERGEDPPGTVELLDWKTTSNLRNAKKGHELIATVQMPAYAMWAARKFNASHLRLSHVYFQTKGKAESRKATRLHTAEEISSRWEEIEVVARSLMQIAKVKPEDSNSVEPNTSACHAWGGCPHLGYCKVGGASSLESMFGKGMSASLLKRFDTKGENTMSLLSKIPGATAPVAPAQMTLDLSGELARLKAEQDAAAVKALPSGFADACKYIEASGEGFPTLLGKAAVTRGDMLGTKATGAGIAGSGMLGGLSLSDPAQVMQLADELKARGVATPVASPGVAPIATVVSVGLLPPDAPESNPALAAKPLDLEVTAFGAQFQVNPGVVTTAVQGNPVVADAPRKRGRPRKDAPSTPIATDIPIASAAPMSSGSVMCDFSYGTPASTAPVQTTAPTLAIYVDCIPSRAFERLEPYVDSACATLAKEFGAVDIRCAPKDGPLSYGQWKGALAALVRERPPAPGVYVLLSRSDTAEVVADALSAMTADFVRGVR